MGFGNTHLDASIAKTDAPMYGAAAKHLVRFLIRAEEEFVRAIGVRVRGESSGNYAVGIGWTREDFGCVQFVAHAQEVGGEDIIVIQGPYLYSQPNLLKVIHAVD